MSSPTPLTIHIALQLARIEAALKASPTHASGPQKLNLSQLESLPKK